MFVSWQGTSQLNQPGTKGERAAFYIPLMTLNQALITNYANNRDLLFTNIIVARALRSLFCNHVQAIEFSIRAYDISPKRNEMNEAIRPFQQFWSY